MISQREFIEKHQKYLNEKFIEDNPDGQFVIQRGEKCIAIYVNFKRRTSHTSYLYPSAFGIKCSNFDKYYFVDEQNNSFGKVTHYNSLDKFIKNCRKYGIKEKAIKTFLSHYENCRKILNGEITGEVAQKMIKKTRKH